MIHCQQDGWPKRVERQHTRRRWPTLAAVQTGNDGRHDRESSHGAAPREQIRGENEKNKNKRGFHTHIIRDSVHCSSLVFTIGCAYVVLQHECKNKIKNSPLAQSTEMSKMSIRILSAYYDIITQYDNHAVYGLCIPVCMTTYLRPKRCKLGYEFCITIVPKYISCPWHI